MTKLQEILTLALLMTEEEFDPDTVTPGVEGFILTGLLAVAGIFLIIDVFRRLRRVAMREEITDMLDAEEREAAEQNQAQSDSDESAKE